MSQIWNFRVRIILTLKPSTGKLLLLTGVRGMRFMLNLTVNMDLLSCFGVSLERVYIMVQPSYH
jgi:hypothetical protein